MNGSGNDGASTAASRHGSEVQLLSELWAWRPHAYAAGMRLTLNSNLRPWAWRGFAILISALGAAWMAYAVISLPDSHPDFAEMWAAARGGNPYDPAVIAANLRGVRTPELVFFAYPPSALPIFGLFGLAHFPIALITWVALSGGALAASSRSRWSPLLLITPAVLWALPGGQTSVLVGALLYGGLQLLNRPGWAGLLLGLALSVKPQIAVIALASVLAIGHWRILLVAGATFLALSLLSLGLYGLDLWPRWLHALPAFVAINHTALAHNEIAPRLPAVARVAALVAAIAAAVWAMRRKEIPAAFVAACGGALLASPHAMGYEFAALAPALPALFGRGLVVRLAVAAFVVSPMVLWMLPNEPDLAPRACALGLFVVMVCLGAARRAERPTPGGATPRVVSAEHASSSDSP